MRDDACILGIDPGLCGALAWLRASGEVIDVADLPILDGGPRRKSIDAVQLAALLKRHRIARAAVEAVHARPTDSKVGAFTFGRNLGALEAVVLASGIPLDRVHPITWRRLAGLSAGVSKEASIAAALRLCPSARPFLDGKAARHDRADAILIALWSTLHAQAARP
jgi:crossover junction endodeoxyribonuclease RuvC